MKELKVSAVPEDTLSMFSISVSYETTQFVYVFLLCHSTLCDFQIVKSQREVEAPK